MHATTIGERPARSVAARVTDEQRRQFQRNVVVARVSMITTGGARSGGTVVDDSVGTSVADGKGAS